MAVNERTFVRILPESSGDRIGFRHVYEIEYTGKTGNFLVGATVTGATSNTSATITKDTIDNDTNTSGVLSVTLDSGFEAKSYISGENLQVDAVTQAVAGTNYCIYINKNTLISYDNPQYGQLVDIYGSAYTRFPEGAIQFDSVGKTQISEQSTIIELDNIMDTKDIHYTETLVAGGSSAHDSNSSALVLSCGTGTTDSAIRYGNNHCPAQEGISQLWTMSLSLGDSGKTNLHRKWGYADENDGIYFYLNDTVLSIVSRSSVTGSVVDTPVTQSNFNRDHMDGSKDINNPSELTLNVANYNSYWLDLQNASGRIRCGVNIDGVRIILHEFRNTNNISSSFLKRASLPVYIEQTNIGAVASTSEMRIYSTTVKIEGPVEHTTTHLQEKSGLTVTASTTVWLPILSIRPKVQYNGLDNHGYLIPLTLSTSAVDTSDLSDARYKIEIFRNASLTGPTWVNRGEISQHDVSSTAMTGGTAVAEFLVKGTDTLDLEPFFNSIYSYLNNDADLTQNTFTVAIKKIDATPTVSATGALTWKELRL